MTPGYSFLTAFWSQTAFLFQIAFFRQAASFIRALLAGLGILLLTACGTIITQPPASQLYTLRPLAQSEHPVEKRPINLIIPRPITSPGLEREYITLIKPDHQLSYYAQVRWTAPTSELVRYFFIDSLQNQDVFQSVTPDGRFNRDNYRLDIHVQDFQTEYALGNDNPSLKLKLAFTLTDLAKRTPAATFVEAIQMPVENNRMSSVVDAFQTAMDKITLNALAKIDAAVPSMAKPAVSSPEAITSPTQ